MIEIINSLIEDSGFSKIGMGDNSYLFSDFNDNRKSYWLVVETDDPTSVLEEQADLFNQCKATLQDKALDKNISLLILWNTGGYLDLGHLKKRVMRVEEDPYFFKKYVLYFSDKELDCLNETIDGSTLNEFIQNRLVSTTTFSNYKEDPESQENWQPLLYRIAIKIPFIPVKTGESSTLDSLFRRNDEAVQGNREQSLIQFDQILFQQTESLSYEDILKMDVINLLEHFSLSEDNKDDS